MWKRLLVLDDDHFARVTLAAALRSEGYDVLAVEPGPDAVDLVHARPVDLAIVAVTADHPGGVNALASLQVRRKIPSIALTNIADHRLVQQARHHGTVAQMEKPVDIKGLLSAIEQALPASPA